MNATSSGITGGCRRGAVRHRADMAPPNVRNRRCRMGQRAVGNVVAALAPIEKERLRQDGEPSGSRSSPVATRGPCNCCSTSRTLACDASASICVTPGCLDPAAVRPEIDIEARVPWLHITDAPTDANRLAGTPSHPRT